MTPTGPISSTCTPACSRILATIGSRVHNRIERTGRRFAGRADSRPCQKSSVTVSHAYCGTSVHRIPEYVTFAIIWRLHPARGNENEDFVVSAGRIAGRLLYAEPCAE